MNRYYMGEEKWIVVVISEKDIQHNDFLHLIIISTVLNESWFSKPPPQQKLVS